MMVRYRQFILLPESTTLSLAHNSGLEIGVRYAYQDLQSITAYHREQK